MTLTNGSKPKMELLPPPPPRPESPYPWPTNYDWPPDVNDWPTNFDWPPMLPPMPPPPPKPMPPPPPRLPPMPPPPPKPKTKPKPISKPKPVVIVLDSPPIVSPPSSPWFFTIPDDIVCADLDSDGGWGLLKKN